MLHSARFRIFIPQDFGINWHIAKSARSPTERFYYYTLLIAATPKHTTSPMSMKPSTVSPLISEPRPVR